MPYSLQIGMRYLRSKKRSTVSVITFVAVTGVALGVAALLAVLSITSGFQKEFRDKVLGVNAHVLVLKYGLDFTEYRDVIAQANDEPEVAGAAPFLINEMMLAKGDRLSGTVLLKGVDPELMPQVLDLPQQVVEGSLEGMRVPGTAPAVDPDDFAAASPEDDLDSMLQQMTRQGAPDGVEPDAHGPGTPPDPGPPPPTRRPLPEVEVPSPEDVERALEEMGAGELEVAPQGPDDSAAQQEPEDDAPGLGEQGQLLPGIVVGRTLADNLDLAVGDRVKVVSPLTGLDVSAWKPEARTPRSRHFRVIGIFEAGFQEYDSRLVYVDLYEAQRFYDNGDSVTGVELRLHDLQKAGFVSDRLERDLGGPFHTMDWAELNHNLFAALEIQKIMLSLVIASIIIVAAFNVVATLIMIVLEKKREVAILKAMGATDGAILRIFMVQGSVIGIVGTVIGLLLGGGVVAYLEAYQFPLDPKVYLIDHLPVVVSSMEFLITTAVAVVICTGATLIPSWWAARLLPAEGVRYE